MFIDGKRSVCVWVEGRRSVHMYVGRGPEKCKCVVEHRMSVCLWTEGRRSVYTVCVGIGQEECSSVSG